MKNFLRLLKVPLFLFLYIASINITFAQEAQKADSVSLKKFINDTEARTNYHFFFNTTQIDSVFIPAISPSGLEEKLPAILRESGLKVYFEDGDVFIYKGIPITKNLPDYQEQRSASRITTNENTGLTEAEKNYIQGKAIASKEILSVGDKKNTIPGKTCVINGKIIDESSGEPLIGATVYIPELEAGSLTDIDGRFKLAVVPGKYDAKINHMSMKEQEYILNVYSSGSIEIEMAKELIKINEVVVSSTRNDNVKGMQMGYEKLSAKTMKEIPAVMGEKDVLKIAQMLPGVTNVGEGSSGFNVRGSSADQNLFYLNKIPVYNTSHLLGFFTAFSPDIIQDFTLYKSSIPARYGGRLASVFDVSTRQGNKKEFFGQGGISPVTAHFEVEGPMVKDKVSVVASYRSSYSDWILQRIEDSEISNSHAFFYDASLGVNAEINDKNLVKAFVYKSDDAFSLSDKNEYYYSNTGGSTSWKHIFTSSLTGDFSLVYSDYEFENIEKINPSDAFKQKYDLSQYELRSDFNMVTPTNHRLEFGLSSVFYNINRGTLDKYGESTRKPVNLGYDKGVETALYISDEFQVLPRLNLLAGLRFSSFAELGDKDVYIYKGDELLKENIIDSTHYNSGQIVKFYSGPEFRTALNYSLTNSTSVKASYNRTRQYIFMLSNTIAISPNDQWKLVSQNIKPPVADQVALGIYQNITQKGIELSLEAYYKRIKNIVEYKDGATFISSDPIEQMVLQGDQFTRGLEFMLRKKTGQLTGWLSYTYSRSIIQVSSSIISNQINNGNPYPSNYDRPHSLNLVSTYKFNRRLSMSGNFVYTTGRPFTAIEGWAWLEGGWSPINSSRNEYRIPDYIRLDLSVNLEGNLLRSKLGHSYWMVNVYNALGRKNAYSVFPSNQSGEAKYYKLSIFAQPIFTISWNFKFGNYLSE